MRTQVETGGMEVGNHGSQMEMGETEEGEEERGMEDTTMGKVTRRMEDGEVNLRVSQMVDGEIKMDRRKEARSPGLMMRTQR